MCWILDFEDIVSQSLRRSVTVEPNLLILSCVLVLVENLPWFKAGRLGEGEGSLLTVLSVTVCGAAVRQEGWSPVEDVFSDLSVTFLFPWKFKGI